MDNLIFATQILTEFQVDSPKDYKIKAVILLQSKNEKIYSQDLMGKSVLNWVEDCLKDFKVENVKIDDKKSMIEAVLPLIKDEDYLVVLYGDTPLIHSQSILDAVEYATTKNLDFCKLYRGAIIKTSAVKTNTVELTAEANFLNREEFFAVFDNKSICFAREKIRQEIIEKHLSNGVDIYNKNNCYIDCNVVIGKGVKVQSNNVLKGKTIIGSNVLLRENNVIENSEIGENCEVFCSVIKDYKTTKACKIGPFKELIGGQK